MAAKDSACLRWSPPVPFEIEGKGSIRCKLGDILRQFRVGAASCEGFFPDGVWRPNPSERAGEGVRLRGGSDMLVSQLLGLGKEEEEGGTMKRRGK